MTVVSGAKPMSKASSHADTDPFVKHADHIENAKSLNGKCCMQYDVAMGSI